MPSSTIVLDPRAFCPSLFLIVLRATHLITQRFFPVLRSFYSSIFSYLECVPKNTRSMPKITQMNICLWPITWPMFSIVSIKLPSQTSPSANSVLSLLWPLWPSIFPLPTVNSLQFGSLPKFDWIASQMQIIFRSKQCQKFNLKILFTDPSN